jgi:predicted nucleic acid-binding protein
MADRLVINTGPLVTLARTDLLELVGKLPLAFICPREVIQEIEEGVALGYPAVRPAWLSAVALSRPVDPVARAALDLGEAAVIQLALEQGVTAVGLKVAGTLGLLARAKTIGLISTLRPLLEKLQLAGAYYDEELLRRVLAAVGE